MTGQEVTDYLIAQGRPGSKRSLRRILFDDRATRPKENRMKYLKIFLWICVALIIFALLGGDQLFAQARCSAIAAASYGGWKPVSSAPHDGTTVELLQTYGIAPTYGLAKWTKTMLAQTGQTGKLIKFTMDEPQWVSTTNPRSYYTEDECLYWRPYKSTSKPYVDPTGGAQNTVAYWCLHMQRPYDAKRDRCL